MLSLLLWPNFLGFRPGKTVSLLSRTVSVISRPGKTVPLLPWPNFLGFRPGKAVSLLSRTVSVIFRPGKRMFPLFRTRGQVAVCVRGVFAHRLPAKVAVVCVKGVFAHGHHSHRVLFSFRERRGALATSGKGGAFRLGCWTADSSFLAGPSESPSARLFGPV